MSIAAWDLSVALILIIIAGSRGSDCVLPAHPVHGKYDSYEADCPASSPSQGPQCGGVPGTKVSPGWLLFVSCHPGFRLAGEGGPSVCEEGGWVPSLPTCIYDLENDKQRCVLPAPPAHGSYEPLPLECATSGPTTPGQAVASACPLVYSCDPGYQLGSPDLVVSLCENSSWSPPPHDITCRKTDQDVTHPTSTASTTGCSLPPEARNRQFCSFHCQDCDHGSCRLPPGSSVTDLALRVQCEPGYGFTNFQPYVAVVCVNGTWIPNIPDCLKLCPALESDSVYPRCLYGTTQVDCSKAMLPGTTAVYHCKPSHTEYPSLSQAGVYQRTLTCKHDGKWSYLLPECKPACGVSKGDANVSATIVGGEDTKLGVFPWHAGLYRREQEEWKYICGGSLISDSIVLTAAHCVALSQPSELRVGLGKYFRSWSTDEPQAVKRNVTAIRVPQEYNGAVTSYVWDLALLLLADKVQINSFVMPVCRDVQGTLDITRNSTGHVVGWGKTSAGGNQSETLLNTNFTILDHWTCLRQIPRILSFDKFCGSKDSVSVAEKGDSGGGMTVAFNGLHYIFGLVSLKYNELSVFTNISWKAHRTWMEHEINSLVSVS